MKPTIELRSQQKPRETRGEILLATLGAGLFSAVFVLALTGLGL
ncbi:hypothetical protein [Methylophaga lonarensis]